MNNTFAIFDGKLLVTGSYNWTEYSEKFNYENAIFIDDLDVIGKYKKEFDSLYNEGVAQGAKREEESHVDASVATETVSSVSGEGTLSGQGDVHKAKHKGVKGAIPDDKVSTPVAVTGSRHIKKPEEIQKVKPVVKPQKLFSNVTVDEFDKIFSGESKLTKLEKKRLWEEDTLQFVTISLLAQPQNILRLSLYQVCTLYNMILSNCLPSCVIQVDTKQSNAIDE